MKTEEERVDLYEKILPYYRQVLEKVGLLDSHEEALRYVYNSVAIEGNTFSFDDTVEFLNTGMVIVNKRFLDHLEVKDMWDAYQYTKRLEEEKELKDVSKEMIMDIHKQVLYRTNPNNAGVMKRQRNRNAYRLFPDVLKSKMLFNKAIEVFHDNINKKHGLAAGVELHYDLWNAHPFTDGNKRTARLMVHFVMEKCGLPALRFRQKNVNSYFKNLREAYEKNDKSIFVNYCYKVAVKQMEKIIDIGEKFQKKKITERICAFELSAL